MALWAGRFSKEIDAGVNAFNSSISFDARMYRQDIRSIAQTVMEDLFRKLAMHYKFSLDGLLPPEKLTENKRPGAGSPGGSEKTT